MVGLIVDTVVSELYNHTYDPVGELTRKLNGHLTVMEDLILEGTDESPGLRGSLEEYAARRGAHAAPDQHKGKGNADQRQKREPLQQRSERSKTGDLPRRLPHVRLPLQFAVAMFPA